jgi:hypothetical protein
LHPAGSGGFEGPYLSARKKCGADAGIHYNVLKSQWRMVRVLAFYEFIVFDKRKYSMLNDYTLFPAANPRKNPKQTLTIHA